MQLKFQFQLFASKFSTQQKRTIPYTLNILKLTIFKLNYVL